MWTSLWVVFRRILFMDPLAPPSVALSVWVILLANVYISLNYFSYSWAIRTCSETKPAKSCPKTHWTGGAISPLQWNQTPLPEFRPFSCSPEYLPVAIGQVSIGKKNHNRSPVTRLSHSPYTIWFTFDIILSTGVISSATKIIYNLNDCFFFRVSLQKSNGLLWRRLEVDKTTLLTFKIVSKPKKNIYKSQNSLNTSILILIILLLYWLLTIRFV